MKLTFCCLFLIALISCEQSSKVEFKTWYESYKSKNGKERKNVAHSTTYPQQAAFYSSPLLIDTIYRSMQGPYEIEQVQLDRESDELIWLVGYQSEVEDINQNQKLPAGFMCHNNLNYAAEEDIPWKIKTTGANSRIFTLSEGQTKVEFPEGFGIPIPANQAFEMVSQVLNHHLDSINLKTRHHVTFDYVKDKDLKQTLVPLYQQSVFITKQISGPAGSYGLPHLCKSHHLDSNSVKGQKPAHDCSVDFSGEDYNPYQDEHGRRYTGHWKLPFGKEKLSTDVTQMLDLEEDSRIHMIGVHLHPFAKGLELWDKTTDKLLYAADIQEKNDGFGFNKIDYYKSKSGIPVFTDHRYELRSTYHCNDSTEVHTAMAVMYLYLADV